MWSRTFRAPPSHLQIVPTYCTKQVSEGGQRAAALFCCGLGMAGRGAGREATDEKHEAGGSVLPGFIIKCYATLHLNCVGFVSFLFFFSPPKRVCFFRPGSLIFGCVLGYWHALCTGWTPDWASRRSGQGRRTLSPLSQQPRHQTSAF